MKTIQKILFGALLIGIGCLASTKVVKAAPVTGIELEFNASHQLICNLTGGTPSDPTDPVTNLTISATPTGGTARSIDDPTETTYTLTASEVLALCGNGSTAGTEYTFSATATFDSGATLTTSLSGSVPVYSPSITYNPEQHGSISPSPAKGFMDDDYSATWTAGDGYTFVKWRESSTGTDFTTNPADLQFGHAYVLYLDHTMDFTDPVPASFTGNSGTTFTYDIEVLPKSVYSYTQLSAAIDQVSGCDPQFTWEVDNTSQSIKLHFANPTGNGTFRLDLKYGTNSLPGYPKTIRVGTDFTMSLSGPQTLGLVAPGTYTLTVTPASAKTGLYFEWLSSRPAVLALSGSGDSRSGQGLSNGTSTITVNARLGGATGTIVDSATREVSVGQAPTSISIGTGTLELAVGQDSTLTVTPTPSTASNAVTWSSSNTTIATVDENGKVHAVAQGGPVTITATSKFNIAVTATRQVRVVSKVPATSVAVSHGITKGYKLDLGYNKGVVTPTPANASISKIEWTVASGSDYGTLDSTKAILTGKKQGTITLTPKVFYTDGSDPDTLGNVEVKVYDPVIKNNDSTDSIKFTLPSAAFTANTADDNISSVTGYRVDVLNKDGDSVYNDHFDAEPGKEITLSSGTLNDFVIAASGNLTGDTHKIRFRISPYSSGTYNGQYDSSDVRVAYKSEERTAYKGSDGKYSLSNNNSSSSKGSSTQASTSGKGSGNAGAGLDKVPKTGEGNTRMLIIMIAMISATIAGAILLSYMPARANANKGIAGAEDVKGFFDSTPTTNAKDTNTEQTAANTADKEDDKS